MSFGDQTVTFVTVTVTGQPGYLGVREKNKSEAVVEGCHFRPLRVEETPDAETNVATEYWKCTAPPEVAALAATFTGEVKHEGITYQIDGPVQPKYEMYGGVHHVTIICKRQRDG